MSDSPKLHWIESSGIIAAVIISIISLVKTCADSRKSDNDVTNALEKVDKLNNAIAQNYQQLGDLVSKTSDYVESAKKMADAAAKELDFTRQNLMTQSEMLNESKRQFDITTKPLLQVVIEESSIDYYNDVPTKVKFKIRNTGKIPAEIKYGKFTFYSQTFDHFKLQALNNLMGIEPSLLNYVIVDESQVYSKGFERKEIAKEQGETVTIGYDEANDQQSWYLAGTLVYGKYIDGISKEETRYLFVCRIRENNEVEFIYNKNLPVGDGSFGIDFLNGGN